MVRSEKKGRVRTYQLVPQGLKLAEDWLAQQRDLWERRLDQLEDLHGNAPDKSDVALLLIDVINDLAPGPHRDGRGRFPGCRPRPFVHGQD
jgi:DNA-binding PadR family transcriptional regulator